MSKSPFTGELNRKIIISKEESIQNSTGQPEVNLVEVVKTYSKMVETDGDDQLDGKVIHLIKRKYIIRYHQQIALDGFKMVVDDNGRKFSIYHVMEIGRRKHLALLVSANE